MKTIFSGVQPSGVLHIGNYFGAIKQWVEFQNSGEYRTIFCIVDEHAITVPQEPENLRRKTMEVAMIYLSSGIDPKKSIIFIQSHVPEHAELAWILNTITPVGELQRMTQFKDKTQKQKSVLAGLLNYPVLMAADILLYQTNLVPVGEDQFQHVELAREIARKFNNQFGETFVLPEVIPNQFGKRIMGLDDPLKKMSKSAENPNNHIALFDSPEIVKEKIKTAVTDSGKEIIFDPKKKPAISNLLTIYSLFSGKTIKEIESDYVNKGYEEFKKGLAEVMIGGLAPLQKKYQDLEKNPDYVMAVLREGAEKAKKIASQTLKQVKQKIGFL